MENWKKNSEKFRWSENERERIKSGTENFPEQQARDKKREMERADRTKREKSELNENCRDRK